MLSHSQSQATIILILIFSPTHVLVSTFYMTCILRLSTPLPHAHIHTHPPLQHQSLLKGIFSLSLLSFPFSLPLIHITVLIVLFSNTSACIFYSFTAAVPEVCLMQRGMSGGGGLRVKTRTEAQGDGWGSEDGDGWMEGWKGDMGQWSSSPQRLALRSIPMQDLHYLDRDSVCVCV